MAEDMEKICDTLDKLTLDALTLIEEEVQLKLNIENTMCGGETHLAKTRYIMGQNSVSALQLPTEHSPEFTSSVKVHNVDDDRLLENKAFELRLVKENEDEEAKVQDPIKWFGYLVPQNLNYAQNMFRQALQWVIQAANIQTQLMETYMKIDQLKELKKSVTVK